MTTTAPYAIAPLNMPPLDWIFRWQDPEVGRLAQDIMDKCIMAKIFEPSPPLMQRWIGPGGIYNGQWIWDTMFVVDLLSLLPGTAALIRGVFQNYWDFQAEWDRRMPAHARGMVTCCIKPDMDNVQAWPYAQIPILAWGLERVYRRNRDRQLLDHCLAPLERFHDWYWRERDVTDVGLVGVGAYSGRLRHARWETFDDECNMDSLQLTTHPTRETADADALPCYGDLLVPGNTAYLVLGERCLARLALAVGDHAMAARRQARVERAVDAMRRHMWSEEAGLFLTLQRDTLAQLPDRTIGGWIPLLAGVPSTDMAARMADALRGPDWQTPLPVPTVARSDSRWQSDSFWRGDVWPATNYQIATGLAHYGHHELAAEIADTTIANAIRNGISEYYDSVSGRPLGVSNLGMTCTLLSMMLDGLSRDHTLSLAC